MFDKASADFEVKEIDEEGRFEGLASVFNKVDNGGDMILPGAYKKTLSKIKNQKRVIPYLWRHYRDEIMGGFESLEETAKGLYVKGRIIPDLSEHSMKTYRLMKSGLARGLSIGYRVPIGGADKVDGIRKIKTLDLYEISFVAIGMDPYANITNVKNMSDIRTKLSAGDPLTPREWEALLKEQCNLTNSEAERYVNAHLKNSSGDPSDQKETYDLISDLKSMLN